MTTERIPGVNGALSDRVYRALVRSVFPKAFRLDYEPQLVQVFADRIREVRNERRFGATYAIWCRTVVDLLVSGLRLRVQACGDSLGRWRRNRNNRHRIGAWMSSLISDLRYALRTLWKVRGFSVIAILTLALGIGANTAIFTVLNGIALKPLPYFESDRVVRVWPRHTFGKALLVNLGEQTRSYSGLSGFSTVNLTLTGMGEPEEFYGGSVSVNHFDLLGVAPLYGRAFLPEEQVPGQDNVVILSHEFWERRFGADPGIVGQTVQLGGAGGESRTVIGILPPAHRPVVERWRAWLPMTIDPTNQGDYSGTASLAVIGRLKPSVSVDQAQSELRVFTAQLKETGDYDYVPDEEISGARVVPALDELVGDVRARLVLLFVAVGFVLLIGCTNVANLLLARGTARSREIGIRLAIGARRFRVIRQLLTEAALLGVIGGAAGFCVALWSVSMLKAGLPPGVPRADLITVDARVLGFTFALSLLASLVFGLLPALRATRSEVRSALEEGSSAAGASRGRLRINGGLVVAETALAVVLVVGAGLVLKSFWMLNRIDPGFNVENLVTMRVSPPTTRYTDGESIRAYYAQVAERLKAAPGVTSVSLINLLPMTGGNIGLLYEVEGSPLPDGSHRPRANARTVYPGYFTAMGIPVLEGRELDITDVDDGPILVNETMARHIAPDGDVIGKRVGGFFGPDMFTVIGVVADMHQHRLQLEPMPEMYFSSLSWTNSTMYLLVRTAGDAENQIAALQGLVWSIDEDVPISRTMTMEDVIGRSIADTRFLAQLLTGFAVVALILGAIGVYGVLSYAVSQRSREIGLRMALGAPSGAVLRSALGQGTVLVAGGVVVGILGAAAASRLLSGFLYGVSATDPATFAAVGLFLMVVAVVASFVPARRASRIDPIEALRFD